MKKFIYMIMAMTLLVSLIACGTSVEQTNHYPEVYQGLTKEEYEDLQAQKAKYEAMTDEQKQIAREGGTVGCKKFVHLWWEETIDMNFINYVGSDRFSEWIGKNRDNDNCLTIYSFSDEFGLDLNTLKTIVTENHLEEFYPLDRLETRYNYLLNILEINAPSNVSTMYPQPDSDILEMWKNTNEYNEYLFFTDPKYVAYEEKIRGIIPS